MLFNSGTRLRPLLLFARRRVRGEGKQLALTSLIVGNATIVNPGIFEVQCALSALEKEHVLNLFGRGFPIFLEPIF
jgi:hypothetical protein